MEFKFNKLPEEIPELPPIDIFSNYSLGIACIEAHKKHTKQTLKLRTIQFGSFQFLTDISVLLENVFEKGDYNYSLNIEIENSLSEKIKYYENPIVNDLPNALADILLGEDNTKTDISEDILNENNIKYIDRYKKTSKADDIIKEIIGTYELEETHADSIIKNIIKIQLNESLFNLFMRLDDLTDYLTKTEYINKYKEWKDINSIIEDNCPNNNIMGNDFLFFDDEKTDFIMPIYLSNGSIIISKFFRGMNYSLEENCKRVQKLYNRFLIDKINIIEKAEKIFSELSDKENPFEKLKINIFDKKDIVNTLF